MKKIFTFVAAALMAVSAFAAKETVLEVNFAEFASEQIGTLGGSNINITFGEQVNLVNTDVYSLSVDGLLEAGKVYVNRNSDMLVRYADIRTIGLYSKNTPTFVIPGLKKDDIVEIAWNAGGKSDGTYWDIDSTLTYLGNVEVTGDWGEYAFSHTSGGTERTINYSTRQLKVQADGDIRFAVPSVKGDGSNWKMFFAYIKVTREAADEPVTPEPEPEKEYEAVMDVNFAAFAAEQIGTLGGSNINVTFGEQESKMNVNVYPLSVEGLLEAGNIYVNRNSDMLIRYADIRTIGLYSKNTPTFVIPGLKKDDIIEIAWNAGGKGDGTYWEIDSTLTSLANVEESGEWGEYAFSHTSGGTERTINYSTHQLKVAADGDVRFAVPSVKGDGSNWKMFFAYIKVLRVKEAGPTTGFDAIESSVKAVKMIENGQVVILRDGVRYNVLGAKL
ncbi:MAG: hypothetical protein IJ814_02330 [Paludibacteraceae bacterium]|nr:hypothetical protein [Paludibacteraceae bacterium]